MLQPPKIDRRTAEDLVRQVHRLAPGAAGHENRLAAALINVFARFGEIVIERINKVPQKNLLAFLDLLGISRLPPQAAQVPLTFYTSEGSPSYVPVPIRTQVAATPAKDEKQPVVFETAYELVVTSARLESLMASDSASDEYMVLDPILTPPEPAASATGTAGQAVQAEPQGEVRLLPHIFYIGLKTYPEWPKVNQISLKFAMEDSSAARDVRIVRWEIAELPAEPPKPAQRPALPMQASSPAVVWNELAPLRDDTDNLTKSGEIVFLNVPELPSLELEGAVTHWLRCRLLTAITREHEPALGMVRETHLPRIKSVEVGIRLDRKSLPVEQAFTNQVKADTSKDFFPFGERPKFGDTLYLANRQVFSNPDALVKLHITLTNPASGGAQGLPPAAPNNTKLRWEYWEGQSWAELGTSELSRRVRISQEPAEGSAETEFFDTTQTLSQSGTVSFRFGKPPRECVVNGQENFWIRVRLAEGDYGKNVQYERNALGVHTTVPPTFAPPSIHSITIDYTVDKSAKAESLVAYNNFLYRQVAVEGEAFQPFIPAPPDHAVYFGFDAPASKPAQRAAAQKSKSGMEGTIFPNRSMSIYVSLKKSEESKEALNPALWEYWNGSGWTKWTVRDDTQGLRRTGLIRFLAPSDYAPRKEFGVEKYWLRMILAPDRPLPELRRALLNTTLATQVASFKNEILGTSNGKPRQKFYVLHAPILEGQHLEILELVEPPLHEQKRIREEEGDDAITKTTKASGKGEDVWVRWHETPNFYGSSPRDRHYVLDRLTGEVRFGDGLNGLIPPAVPGNIRMTSYKSGGGSAGNKAAGAVTQLKSAVPYITKVFNWEPASGGADAEAETAMLERGTHVLRHGGRAVTAEDFEDLALLASPGVARAKCISNHNLLEDPEGRHRRPGFVSVVIVPRSNDPRPMPDAALLGTVRSYLEDHSAPTIAGTILLGPVYMTLGVNVEIVVGDIDVAGDVELAATLALQRFLHPLTGGREGAGWDFGGRPHRSDFYALLEQIPGVNYVRSLELVNVNGGAEISRIAWSLICCGHLKITTLVED